MTEPSRSAQPFVVMAKPVGPVCNLACGYCYYLDTAAFYARPHSFRMSDETLEAFIRSYIESSPGPVVPFVWHGGEPTLAGLDFYRRAVELQRRYLPTGWTCWNNLQTNGTLLDAEWCTFLKDERFDVGLSIDGPRALHDTFRLDVAGRGTHERVLAAARMLQAHGIQPDLLCTVTSSTAADPLGTYRALRELGTGWMQFIPIVRRGPDGTVSEDSVAPEAYGNFLCAVFDEWSQHDLGSLNVQFFAELLRVQAGGTASVCWMAPTCGRVLVVEHDGAVYSCDHYVRPEYRLGDLATSQLADLVDSPEQQRFGDDKRETLTQQCRSCRWLAQCYGACPKDRFATTEDGEQGLNYLCEGLRQFFAYSDGPLRHIVERRRQGARPDVIMAELRASALVRWRGVGRNDPCPCGSGRKAKNCCWWRHP